MRFDDDARAALAALEARLACDDPALARLLRTAWDEVGYAYSYRYARLSAGLVTLTCGVGWFSIATRLPGIVGVLAFLLMLLGAALGLSGIRETVLITSKPYDIDQDLLGASEALRQAQGT